MNQNKIHETIIEIADKYANIFRITRQDLFQTNRYKGGKRKKTINGVSVSTMRMALGYYISNNYPITLTNLSQLIGYSDHSTISTNNKTVYFYIKNNDPYFMSYYRPLEEIGSLYINYNVLRNKFGLLSY